jgi:two-component system nitrate/nitrite response regulator NarL
MPRSVLVVDDDPAFRALASRLLAGLGLAVVGAAGTVASATLAAADLRPESILVDVGLPDGDGVTLAGDLAALPWRPRVVITSTDRDATTPEGARAVGAAGFIAKEDLPNGAVLGLLTGHQAQEYG